MTLERIVYNPHLKYTDAEVDAHIAIHAAIADAHHPTVNITSGYYFGNETVNRPIPHGLGRIPKTVSIQQFPTVYFYKQGYFESYHFWVSGAATGMVIVTGRDATNFYVGEAADYLKSANYYGEVYYWDAIG